jgi:hypothetical protein
MAAREGVPASLQGFTGGSFCASRRLISLTPAASCSATAVPRIMNSRLTQPNRGTSGLCERRDSSCRKELGRAAAVAAAGLTRSDVSQSSVARKIRATRWWARCVQRPPLDARAERRGRETGFCWGAGSRLGIAKHSRTMGRPRRQWDVSRAACSPWISILRSDPARGPHASAPGPHAAPSHLLAVVVISRRRRRPAVST